MTLQIGQGGLLARRFGRHGLIYERLTVPLSLVFAPLVTTSKSGTSMFEFQRGGAITREHPSLSAIGRPEMPSRPSGADALVRKNRQRHDNQYRAVSDAFAAVPSSRDLKERECNASEDPTAWVVSVFHAEGAEARRTLAIFTS